MGRRDASRAADAAAGAGDDAGAARGAPAHAAGARRAAGDGHSPPLRGTRRRSSRRATDGGAALEVVAPPQRGRRPARRVGAHAEPAGRRRHPPLPGGRPMIRAAAARARRRPAAGRCCSGWWSIRWCWCCSRACAGPPAGPSSTCGVPRAARPSGRRSGAACGSRSRAWCWPAAVGIPLAFLFSRYDLPGRAAPRRTGGAAGGAAAAGRGDRLPVPLRRDRLRLAAAGASCSGCSDPPWRLEGAGAILLVHAYSMYVYFYLFVRAALAVAGRLAARGGGQPGRGPLAHPAARGGPPAPSGARRRGAAHLHDLAGLVQRAVHLRRRLPGDDRPRSSPPASTATNGSRWWRRSRSTLLALLALLAAPGRRRPAAAAGGRKGAAPARRCAIRRPAVRVAGDGAGVARWPGAAAAAPDAAAGLVRAGRHLDHRAAPAGLHPPQLHRRCSRTRCGCGRWSTASGSPPRPRSRPWRSGWRARWWPPAGGSAVGRVIEATAGAARGRCRARSSPSRSPRPSASGRRGRAASSWSAPSGSFRSPISYGICRSPVAPCSPASGPSIPRWTRRPPRWAPGAGAPCAG